jgi:uncharacterized membrane protein
MLSLAPITFTAGILLVFFVPGYALVKALFPEWRLRSPDALRRGVEVATLAFVLSVVLTVLVGYALLEANPTGFQAAWSQPLLESVLAAVALVAFLVGWFRGAYAHDPPSIPNRSDTDAGEEGAWELSRELDQLQREERRIRHRLRTGSTSGSGSEDSEQELLRVRERVVQLQQQREAEYAR